MTNKSDVRVLREQLTAVDAQLVAIINGADGSIYSRLKAARDDLVRIWLPLDATERAAIQPAFDDNAIKEFVADFEIDTGEGIYILSNNDRFVLEDGLRTFLSYREMAPISAPAAIQPAGDAVPCKECRGRGMIGFLTSLSCQYCKGTGKTPAAPVASAPKQKTDDSASDWMASEVASAPAQPDMAVRLAPGPSEAEQVQLWKDAHGYGNQATVGVFTDLYIRTPSYINPDAAPAQPSADANAIYEAAKLHELLDTHKVPRAAESGMMLSLIGRASEWAATFIPPTPAQPMSLEAERVAFEDKYSLGTNSKEQDELGDYVNIHVQFAWEGWKSRASISTPEGAPMGELALLAGVQCLCIAADQEWCRQEGELSEWGKGWFLGQLHAFDMYTPVEKQAIKEAREYIEKLSSSASAIHPDAPNEHLTIAESMRQVGAYWTGEDKLCPTFGSPDALRVYTIKMQRDAVARAALATQQGDKHE